jgi:hypothetical protein
LLTEGAGLGGAVLTGAGKLLRGAALLPKPTGCSGSDSLSLELEVSEVESLSELEELSESDVSELSSSLSSVLDSAVSSICCNTVLNSATNGLFGSFNKIASANCLAALKF